MALYTRTEGGKCYNYSISLNLSGPQEPACLAYLPPRSEKAHEPGLQVMASWRREALSQDTSALSRAPRTLTVEEEPIGAAPGLTVRYGFLFLCDSIAHSYRDWSRGAR